MQDAVAELVENRAATRMFEGDHTLWAPEPTDISNRLGWLGEPEHMLGTLDAVRRATEEAIADVGIRHVVWCGMGGSSLFPELLARSSLVASDAPSFTVLDTSHPAAVQRAADTAAATSSLYVFASKSGGTIETRSQLDFFWARVNEPARFVVVTDPGSALDQLAAERGYTAHHATPTIGGRYSALSHFGIVAASLLGVDVAAMLEGARVMANECRADSASNPGLQLGALLGGNARNGRDKAVLDGPPDFAQWLEQLIAESTGKHGTGILPVPGDASDADGPDRVRVSYGHGGDLDLGNVDVVRDAGALGREVMRWEIATALAGSLLRINPFDQPDVEAAKQAASKVLADGPGEIAVVSLDEALDGAGPGGYVALQAFVDPDGAVARSLGQRRVTVRDRTGAAATAAVGPRYLHSTGQLHKGGPPSGTFVQMLDPDLPRLPIPGRNYGFGDLITAQAAGDFAALQSRDRRVHRVPTDW